MVQNITQSNQQSNEAMEKIAESITSVGKSIGDGLALLAAAFQQNTQPPPMQSYSGAFKNHEQNQQPLNVYTTSFNRTSSSYLH